MENLILFVILIALVGSAILYIWKEKKKGTRCIGCPSGGCCSTNNSGKSAKKCTCQTAGK